MHKLDLSITQLPNDNRPARQAQLLVFKRNLKPAALPGHRPVLADDPFFFPTENLIEIFRTRPMQVRRAGRLHRETAVERG